MSTLTKKAPKKTDKKTNYKALAGLWADVRKRELELAEKRKSIAKPLIAALKAAGIVDIKTDIGLVRFISDKKKSPTKKDVLAYFGNTKGENFWKTVPDRLSEYLTLIDESAAKEE